MTESPVRVSVDAGVATVTMDSPHNRNALSTAMIDGLLDAIGGVVSDEGVRVVVLSHTGEVFCSGADLKGTLAALEAKQMPAARLGELLAAVWECPKPLVVRIGGPARGGALGLIAAADIAVCRADATFAFSEVRLGVTPAIVSTTVLARVSRRAAAELFLTGDEFDGTRAAAIGLVSAAVPADQLDEVVSRYVRSLLRGAPAAQAAIKSLARREVDPSIRADLEAMTRLSMEFFTSADAREGIQAFFERRRPSWASVAS